MFSLFILQLPSQSMAEEYQLPCVILLARYVVVNIHMHDMTFINMIEFLKRAAFFSNENTCKMGLRFNRNLYLELQTTFISIALMCICIQFLLGTKNYLIYPFILSFSLCYIYILYMNNYFKNNL